MKTGADWQKKIGEGCFETPWTIFSKGLIINHATENNMHQAFYKWSILQNLKPQSEVHKLRETSAASFKLLSKRIMPY